MTKILTLIVGASLLAFGCDVISDGKGVLSGSFSKFFLKAKENPGHEVCTDIFEPEKIAGYVCLRYIEFDIEARPHPDR